METETKDIKIDPTQHVEGKVDPPPDPNLTSKSLSYNAEESLIVEHNLTVWEAMKAYPMAIVWCLVISACVVMEGYDQILVQSFYAYPQFQLKYGEYVGAGTTGYQITAPWQAGLTNASGVGAFFGTLLNGYLVHKFGHKRVLLGALVLLSAFIFITFFAPNLPVLCVGQVLSGLPWGIFATAAPAYASECLPMVLRVYFTSFTNMCFIIGQLISAGVLRGLQGRPDQWAYRIPFALQWVWPLFLIPLVSMAPPSPWHEVRQGRLESAEMALRRLQRSSANIDPKKTLAMIIYTNNLEEQLQVGTSYWDCFKSFELRRTEIACMCFIGQPLSGANFAYNSSYFFEQVGLDTETTYSLNLGGTGLALAGTLINWFLIMPRYGRRSTYLVGMAVMVTILMTIGILNVWGDKSSIGYVQSALCLLWTFVFQLSVGQLGWALPAEVGSTRLRQKTICLARNAYYLVNVVSGVLQSYFMNPTAWNLSGYTGFFWGGTSLIVLVWAFFRLPETKDRSYEQLDVLFANRVPARHFKKTDADVFNRRDVN
ncbi:hypothetical protein QQX98_005386 [Neonectria punicea]|uniref:Major facilitator superfamily (MFS) profile domain-containing protein n=1 Tax=Neonectria punicea TaxID=979145 RepID=A0ABR1H563_9HYPO